VPLDAEAIAAEVTKRVMVSLRAGLLTTDQTPALNPAANNNAITTDVLIPSHSDSLVATLTNDITGGVTSAKPANTAQHGGHAPAAAAWAGWPGESSTTSPHTTTPMAPGHMAHQLEGFALGASVAPAIRGKILSDEYICLGLLLTPNQSDEFAVSVSQNALQVKQINKNKGIFSIDQWSQAFSIFMSVYLEKFPNQVQQLLKYSFTIREMAKTFQGYAWRSYDENFRLCRATSLWPWDKINQELYMRSVSSSFAATLPQPQFARPPNRGYNSFRPFRQPFRGSSFAQEGRGRDFVNFNHREQKQQLARGDNANQR
jgi:hypothetical protein